MYCPHAGRRGLPPPAAPQEREETSRLALGEVEIDVLQRGPAHLETLQLALAFVQLGDRPGRLSRLDDDLLAVEAVADLGLSTGRGQLGRRADGDDPALA